MRRERNVNLSGDYQKITKINKHYIRNEIYFNSVLTPSLLARTRIHLPNLSDYQMLEDRAVYVSPVLLGKPLLGNTDFSSSTKVEIINKYLKIIQDFESLPLFMQLNLVRAENFYLVDDELIHRGVLIIEDVDFNYQLTMGHLLKAVSKFALDLIDNDLSLFNFKNYFRNLPNNTAVFSIENIIDDVKEVYINDLFVEDNLMLPEEEVVVTSPVKYFNLKFVSLVLIALIMVGTTSFAMRQAIQIKAVNDLNALFKIEQVDNTFLFLDESYSPSNHSITEWDWSVYLEGELISQYQTPSINTTLTQPGDYRVSLKVKDSTGNWSLPYEQTLSYEPKTVASDELDAFRFHLAQYSEETYQSGHRAIQVEPGQNAFYTQDVLLSGEVNLAFSIKTGARQAVDLTVIGYQAGREITRQTIVLTIDEAWTEQQLRFETDLIDKLELEFSRLSDTIYLDDFTIQSNQVTHN
ncbi:MAG TPA: hypothetical protein GXZ74_07295 [Tissierellia bacterium]|nr:hypothetical protein [Tissierellia bacterium]